MATKLKADSRTRKLSRRSAYIVLVEFVNVTESSVSGHTDLKFKRTELFVIYIYIYICTRWSFGLCYLPKSTYARGRVLLMKVLLDSTNLHAVSSNYQ